MGSDALYNVHYRIDTGITEETVSRGTIAVAATNAAAADDQARAWIEINDLHDDPRLDPRIVIDTIERIQP